MWKFSLLLFLIPLFFLQPYIERILLGETLILAQMELAEDLSKRFLQGPLKNKEKFFNPEIHPNFYKCHLEALLLSFKEDLGYKKDLIFQDIHFYFKNVEFISSASHRFFGTPGYLLTFSKNLYTFKIFLPKICHKSFLQEGIYSFQTSDGNILWDNYDQKIHSDSYLVRNKDLQEWIKLYPEYRHLYKKEETEPAEHLTLDEKRIYCAFHHGEVLSAHYFDAFTSLSTTNSKYPWSELLQKGDLCHLRLTKECEPSLKKFYPYSPTRFQFYESLGPYKEYVENFYENLHFQSFHKDLSEEDEKFQLNNRTSFEEKGGFRCVYNF